MVTLEEDAAILSDFGFTHNQAKIYAAIARLRIGSVGNISKVAKVRREHIYRTLPKLEKMGLIQRMLGTPEKIKAISAEDAFSALIKREQEQAEKKVSTLTVEAKTFLEHLGQREDSGLPEETELQFSLVSEKDAIMSKTAAMISNAQTEIVIATSRKKLAKFIFFFADLLKRSLRKGVHIKLLTQQPEEEDALPRIIEEYVSPGKSLELRYTNKVPTHYLIADKETGIETSTEADFAECPLLWTSNTCMLALTQKSFSDAWRTSMNWAANSEAAMDKLVVMHGRR